MFHQVVWDYQIAANHLKRYKSQAVRRCDGPKSQRGVYQSKGYHFGSFVMAMDQPVVAVDGFRAYSKPAQMVVKEDPQSSSRLTVGESNGSSQIVNSPDAVGVARTHHQSLFEAGKGDHLGLHFSQRRAGQIKV